MVATEKLHRTTESSWLCSLWTPSIQWPGPFPIPGTPMRTILVPSKSGVQGGEATVAQQVRPMVGSPGSHFRFKSWLLCSDPASCQRAPWETAVMAVMGPCQPCRRHGWNFGHLASDWSGPGCNRHLGSEAEDRGSLPVLSLSLPFKSIKVF